MSLSDLGSSDLDSSDSDSSVYSTSTDDVWTLGILVHKSPKSSSTPPKEPSMSTAPALKRFTIFSSLPTEIRAIIWELSLEPRVVKIKFTYTRGFYTNVETPATLRVCQDSRKAVTKLYTTSFGGLIFKPQILFNFSLDTLYISQCMNEQTHHFFGILSQSELSKMQSIAIDNNLNTDLDSYEESKDDYMGFIEKNVKFMVGLRLLYIVYEVTDHFNAPLESGPMQLHRRLPRKLRRYWRAMTYEIGDPIPNTKNRDILPPKFSTKDFETWADCQMVWGCVGRDTNVE